MAPAQPNPCHPTPPRLPLPASAPQVRGEDFSSYLSKLSTPRELLIMMTEMFARIEAHPDGGLTAQVRPAGHSAGPGAPAAGCGPALSRVLSQGPQASSA
jgi:hypothetical protein